MKKRIAWNKGLTKQSDGRVAKYARTKTGVRFTEDHKRKLSENHADFSDEKHPMWRGDNIGYTQLHTWVRNKLGKATKCGKCGIKGLSRYHWSHEDHNYSRDLTKYKQLCPACHGKHDRQLRGKTI